MLIRRMSRLLLSSETWARLWHGQGGGGGNPGRTTWCFSTGSVRRRRSPAARDLQLQPPRGTIALQPVSLPAVRTPGDLRFSWFDPWQPEMLGYRFGGERTKVTGVKYRGLRRALLEQRGDVLSVAHEITHVKVSLRARADQRPAE